jgi:hypothetical protein
MMQGTTAKLKRLAGASRVVALHLVRGLVEFSETRLGALATMLSPRQARKLARRHRERPREPSRWFTAEESALVTVLANLIVPSDDIAPGAAQLEVQGRSVAATLDRLAAGSPRRQAVYARGLLALDRLAEDERDCAFVQLPEQDQLRLLRFVDRRSQTWSKPSSFGAKIKTKLVIVYHRWSGLFPAVEFFPTLVQDVLQAFYTDPVSWAWLDYDGPPMPNGYPDLLDRRSSVSEPVT